MAGWYFEVFWNWGIPQKFDGLSGQIPCTWMIFFGYLHYFRNHPYLQPDNSPTWIDSTGLEKRMQYISIALNTMVAINVDHGWFFYTWIFWHSSREVYIRLHQNQGMAQANFLRMPKPHGCLQITVKGELERSYGWFLGDLTHWATGDQCSTPAWKWATWFFLESIIINELCNM